MKLKSENMKLWRELHQVLERERGMREIIQEKSWVELEMSEQIGELKRAMREVQSFSQIMEMDLAAREPAPSYMKTIMNEWALFDSPDFKSHETVSIFRNSSGQKGLSAYLIDSITSSQKKRGSLAFKGMRLSDAEDESNVSDSEHDDGLSKSNTLIISKSAAKTAHKGKNKWSYQPVGAPAISQATTLRKTGSAADIKSRNMKWYGGVSNTIDYRMQHIKKNSMVVDQFNFNINGEFGWAQNS